MRVLAVIPARGGSKRLPRKNVLPFGGRPLLAWSIALAQNISRVSTCVVSTEDREIADVARACGAKIVDRPADLATDAASSIDVLVHAAQAAILADGPFDAIMLLQPTNPLRPVSLVNNAIDAFGAAGTHSLVSLSQRPLKLGTVEGDRYHASYAFGRQSRLMPYVHYENGWLYLTRPDVLLDRHSLTGDDVLAYITERPFDEVDIDDPVDMVIGEAILSAVRDRLGY